MTVFYHDDRPVAHFGNAESTPYWKPESQIEVAK